VRKRVVVACLLAVGSVTAFGLSLAVPTDAPPLPDDTGNILRNADNAVAPLPHQDGAGYYYWDGDEWMWRAP
jgi:hypothetical protein